MRPANHPVENDGASRATARADSGLGQARPGLTLATAARAIVLHQRVEEAEQLLVHFPVVVGA